MSTPERIWARLISDLNPDFGGDWDAINLGDGDVEYTRTDLVPTWKPIETAPKLTEVLVWSKMWNVPYLIKAVLGPDGWKAGGFDISNPNQPTHWMPSPNTPEGTT